MSGYGTEPYGLTPYGTGTVIPPGSGAGAGPWGLSDWQVDFLNDPNQGGLVEWRRPWDSLGRVTSWSTDGGLQHELGVYEAGTASVAVDNTTEALTPGNVASPFNSGGKLVDTYRAIRHWWMYPLVGNLLNDTNLANWGVGLDSAAFETAVGAWVPNGSTTAVRSGTQFHEGTHSMLVSWATGSMITIGYVQCPIPPTRVGAVYTLSAWVYVTGSSSKVKIGCNGASSAASINTGVWERLTVTFTASSAITGMNVFPSVASVAGSQVYVDSVQLELGSSASAYSTTGPQIYPLFRGYVERYPQSWDATGFKGHTDLTAVDALALLSRVALYDVMTQDMLQDNPGALFRFDETSAPSVSIGSLTIPPMTERPQVQNTGTGPDTPLNYGIAGPGIEQLGCVSQPVDILATPPWPTPKYLVSDFANTVTSRLGNGFDGITFEVWVNVDPSTFGILVQGDGVGLSAGAFFQLQYENPGVNAQVITNPLTMAGDYSITSGAPLRDGQWHHVVLTEEYVSGTNITAKLYVDGRLDQSTTFSRASASTFIAGRLSSFGALFPGSLTGWATWSLRGSLSRLAVYPSTLSAARVLSHYQASGGFSGDGTGERAGRTLAWAGWNGPAFLQNGLSSCAPAIGLAGQTALGVIQDCETTEEGVFIADGAGVLTFLSRDYFLLQTTPTVTFGELETPYEAGIIREVDPTLIVNDWSVTRTESSRPQRAFDRPSIKRYFPSTQSVATLHSDDIQTLQYAKHKLRRYKDSHARWPSITITPSANTSLFPIALGLKIGDRITVKRRTSAGVMISDDHFISRIARTAAPEGLSFTYSIVPVDPQTPWVMGTSVMGTSTRMTY